jgi:hypothetical protein
MSIARDIADDINIGNVGLPLKDSNNANVLAEDINGVVTLTADEANVGSNALVVDSSGNVGVGTSSPAQKLHVNGGNLILETPTTNIWTYYKNPSKTYLIGLRGTTSNSLSFYDLTADVERMRIDTSGNVGIGTDSPNYLCEIKSAGSSVLAISAASTSYDSVIHFVSGTTVEGGITYDHNGAFASETMKFRTGNNTINMTLTGAGNLTITGSTAQKATGTTWSNPSDQRLKSNISDYPKGTAELMQVRVREWEYNGKGGTVAGTKGLGVIADEIMTVLPNTVDNYEAKLNVDDEETTQIKKFDATEITWLLVKTTQEQQILIESQQSQIDALTTKTQEQDLTIASLISRIEALESNTTT